MRRQEQRRVRQERKRAQVERPNPVLLHRAEVALDLLDLLIEEADEHRRRRASRRAG